MDFDIIFGNAARAALGPEAVILSLAAIGLNVHFGFTGLLNFGQVGFMLLGAYGTSVTVATFGLVAVDGHTGGPFPVPGAGGALGIPTLRLHSVMFAIVTIAGAEIIRILVGSTDAIGLTGGPLSVSFDAGAFFDLNPYPDGPQDRYWFGTFSFTGQQMVGHHRGVGAGGTDQPGRVPDRAQPVGSGAQVHPGGRGRGSQPGQERVPVQDASPHHRRGHRRDGRGHRCHQDFGGRPQRLQTPSHLLHYTALLLGGAATYLGPVLGAILFWFLREWIESFLRQLAAEAWLPDPVAGFLEGSEGIISLSMVGVTLIVLMLFRPQGLTGNRTEMQLDAQ